MVSVLYTDTMLGGPIQFPASAGTRPTFQRKKRRSRRKKKKEKKKKKDERRSSLHKE